MSIFSHQMFLINEIFIRRIKRVIAFWKLKGLLKVI